MLSIIVAVGLRLLGRLRLGLRDSESRLLKLSITRWFFLGLRVADSEIWSSIGGSVASEARRLAGEVREEGTADQRVLERVEQRRRECVAACAIIMLARGVSCSPSSALSASFRGPLTHHVKFRVSSVSHRHRHRHWHHRHGTVPGSPWPGVAQVQWSSFASSFWHGLLHLHHDVCCHL